MRSGGNDAGKPSSASDEQVPHRKNAATPSPQKRGHPHRKNAGENNTSINNKTSLVAEVIGYLNQVTGKRFSPKAKANREIIEARVNEADYTLEDFKQVIDKKAAEWTGQVSSSGNPMTNYLQPATLFSNKHFDAYLNEAPTKAPHSEPQTPEDPQDTLREYAKKQAALYVGLSAKDVAAKVVHDWTQGDIKPDPQQVLGTVQEYRKAGKTNETH